MPAFKMPGQQRTPAGFQFEDMAFVPQGYGMPPPVPQNDRLLGAVNALAMFAGTLAGNQQVIDVAQQQWLQREHQRTQSFQRSMMMQAAQNKLAYETEQAGLERMLKGIGPAWHYQESGVVNPEFMAALAQETDPVKQAALISKMLPPTQHPAAAAGEPPAPGRYTPYHIGSEVEQRELSKSTGKAVDLSMGLAAAQIASEAPAKTEAAVMEARALQPIEIETARRTKAAQTRAGIETKHALRGKIAEVTAAETQRAQPKPIGPASPTRKKYASDREKILKAHAASYKETTGSIVTTYQEMSAQSPADFARRSRERMEAIRRSAQPDLNAHARTELEVLANQPPEQARAELASGAGYDLLSGIQPGPPPDPPELPPGTDPMSPEAAQAVRAYEQAMKQWQDQGLYYQYMLEQLRNIERTYQLED